MSNLRILVVDDLESMRALLCAGLRGLGHTQVATAEDGVGALRSLKSRAHDVVLLDAEMPRMGGLDTLRAIRADQNLSALSVIIVTGHAEATYVQQFAVLGIDGYLVKPVSTAALGARLDAVRRKLAAAQSGATLVRGGSEA